MDAVFENLTDPANLSALALLGFSAIALHYIRTLIGPVLDRVSVRIDFTIGNNKETAAWS